MLQRNSDFASGYLVGGAVSAVAAVVVWTGVLLLQVLQANRVPVKTTQMLPLQAFPDTGIVVVSQACANAPLSAGRGARPPDSPVFDFASVTGRSMDETGRSTVSLRRPIGAEVLWKQQRVEVPRPQANGPMSCTLTVAGFPEHSASECLERSADAPRGDAEVEWTSKDGWVPCTPEDGPFDPLVGLNVGNWSTSSSASVPRRTQMLPSWPDGSFFLVPCPEEGLSQLVEEVYGRLQRAVSTGAPSRTTPLAVQRALSVAFPNGAWLFQASNMDPFANIGPLVVSLSKSRCEGDCGQTGADVRLAATVAGESPRWRQPLCDPTLRDEMAHQACVPIVLVASMQEAVVISTVAFRWPSLLAQWLAPLIAFVLLLPLVLTIPRWRRWWWEQGSNRESADLVGGFESGESAGEDFGRKGGAYLPGGQRVHPSVIGEGRAPKLDDDL